MFVRVRIWKWESLHPFDKNHIAFDRFDVEKEEEDRLPSDDDDDDRRYHHQMEIE